MIPITNILKSADISALLMYRYIGFTDVSVHLYVIPESNLI